MSTQAFTYHDAERRELTLSHAPKTDEPSHDA
jgi:hypothetical protein